MEAFEFDTVLGTPGVRVLLALAGTPQDSGPSRYVRAALDHAAGKYGLGVVCERAAGDLLHVRLRGTPEAARDLLVGLGGLVVTDALAPDSLGLAGARADGRGPLAADEPLIRALREAGLEVLDTASTGRHGVVAWFRGDAEGVRAAAGILGAAFQWSTHASQAYWNPTW